MPVSSVKETAVSGPGHTRRTRRSSGHSRTASAATKAARDYPVDQAASRWVVSCSAPRNLRLATAKHESCDLFRAWIPVCENCILFGGNSSPKVEKTIGSDTVLT